MKTKRLLTPAMLSTAIASAVITAPAVHAETGISEYGKPMADLRLRYETNDTDGGTDAATALTLRSRLGFETVSFEGFKVLAEIEDIRAIVDEYSPQDADYDGVGDPENTEWNRVQVAYTKDGISAVLGRQRIILDNARFIGNVGWRQNEVTYDAAKLGYKKDGLNLTYAYIDQRNFLNFTDNDVSDHLLNVSFTGLSAGKVAAYAYLLENEDTDVTIDTYGAYLDGKQKLDSLTVLYRAEFATQSRDTGAAEFDTSYILLEGGVQVSGVTVKLGNEIKGTDDGAAGFITPYGTNHKFGGWADRYLGTPGAGLDDKYVSVAGKAGPVKLVAAYHDYSGVDDGEDFGSEINLLAAGKINKNFSAGLKYAAFSEGDDAANDTNKLWAWIGAKF